MSTSQKKRRILVRATDEQLALIDARCRALSTPTRRMPRSHYILHAAFDTFPPVVPELNRLAWQELARAAGNLNQVMRRINSGKLEPSLKADTQEVREALHALRQMIIGAAVTPPEGSAI